MGQTKTHYPDSPKWVRDLIIYEIATRSFTSPAQPGSGTFSSLRERLPYLAELGINGVWLTGHSLADPTHFYNIWTQYAVIDPSQLDPTLGTPEDFRLMIDTAHQHGIKIFLDVITHGVMANSPLIEKHPDWFKGGTWGMVDFAWDARNPELDQWWVDTWTDYVVHYGVDGFRLDVGARRPDLWRRIRQNAEAFGHSIVIFPELEWEPANQFDNQREIMDFTQRDNYRLDPLPTDGYIRADDWTSHQWTNWLAKVIGDFDMLAVYDVYVIYSDGTQISGDTAGAGSLGVRDHGLTVTGERYFSVTGLDPDRAIDNVIVTYRQHYDGHWQHKPAWDWLKSLRIVSGEGSMALYFEPYTQKDVWLWPSVSLSHHDNGWQGFTDSTPYVAQGSRFMFGYGALFSGMIPIFFAGEEFNADYVPLPTLSDHLYGGANPGQGKWLYGGVIPWEQLEQPEKRAMLEDVQRLIHIRRRDPLLLAARSITESRNIMRVPFTADADVPPPYLRWHADRVVVVVGNPYTDRDVTLDLQLLPSIQNLLGGEKYYVTDLWTGQGHHVTSTDLHKLHVTVRRDKSPQGGIQLLQVQSLS